MLTSRDIVARDDNNGSLLSPLWLRDRLRHTGGVANIEKATEELKSQGYKLLIATRKEPWGQVVTRLLGPEGLLVGITHTPGMRK